MDEFGLLQPRKISGKECPGLELFTFAEVPNELGNVGPDGPDILRRLIEKRLEKLRLKNPTTGNGTPFAPLVEGGMKGKAGGEENPLSRAANTIADEIWASAAQNPMLASHMFMRYWDKLRRIGFACEDLISPLLVSQEEMLFADMQEGAGRLVAQVPVAKERPPQTAMRLKFTEMQEEPPVGAIGIGTAGFGAGVDELSPPNFPMPVPQKPPGLPKMQRNAENADIMEVRLVSIREMLKHYFREYPEDYAKALGCALGLVADETGDAEFLEQRVAFEVARVGSWALSLRVLEEVKKEQEKRSIGAHDEEPDPWRMGLRIRAGRGKKPWTYSKGSRNGDFSPIFCPRWNGLGWSVAVGMLSSFLSR